MKQLFSPVSIGTLSLKNRIVFAPTSMGKAGIGAYERIAAGGCGLFILADLSVIPSLLGAPALDSDRQEAFFRQIIDACHKHGCKISAQLFHPEYDTDFIRRLYQRSRTDGSITPEEVRKELAASTRTYCDSLTREEIETITGKFSEAAKRAERFGFDMVQIHGDRLMGSFTSPLFNHRTDEYSSHSFFPGKVFRAVRLAVPGLPLDYKLTIRLEEENLGRGGITLSEVPDFIKMLDGMGADSYHVALANHTNTEDTIPVKNHPRLSQEGCFSQLALEVKKHTSNPVCTVGKLQHLEKMKELLEAGIDLIGMSRQLIADPDWPKKAEASNTSSIHYCLYCNKSCLGSLKTGKAIECVRTQRA